MHPQFMRCLLSSSGYQKRMVDEAGGATIKHIYITRVDKMPVIFPESIEDQKKVIASLDSITAETQRLARLYEQKLAALEALKKSLLHQAFTGAL
jgi:type I restriction enzyme S subunit